MILGISSEPTETREVAPAAPGFASGSEATGFAGGTGGTVGLGGTRLRRRDAWHSRDGQHGS